MLKTPISILQELAVQKKLALPDYEISGSGQQHNMSFQCSVKVGKEHAIGTGATKKEAKHDAASKLLETFGINTKMNTTGAMPNICLLSTKTRKDFPIINYVGKLNEFSAMKRFPQPSYHDGDLLYNAQFCMLCRFQQLESAGYGSTKKDAKQDAAKKMWTLITETGLKDNSTIMEESSKLNVFTNNPSDGNFEDVLQAYTEIIKNMSIKNVNSAENNNYLDSPKKLYVDVSSWHELILFINERGWSHQVTVFQTNPLMLCLKINQHTLINFGESQRDIHMKFVHSVVQMLEEERYHSLLQLLKYCVDCQKDICYGHILTGPPTNIDVHHSFSRFIFESYEKAIGCVHLE